MANLLADAQLPLRAAGAGTLFLLVAGHCFEITSSCPRQCGVGICICPVETNEAWMAGANPAIALSQFQFKKIRALR
jgi:hypothetical protein